MDSKAPREKGRLGKLANLRWPLLVWAIFGTALTLSDGILTPAVSVDSAVEGIAVAQPSVTNAIVGISIAFIIFLFGLQPLGTQKIAFFFAPVTATWLALLGATGIYNIVSYPAIWRAYDPSRAILWFVRTGSYDNLAGVLLAITGCEAMFANLGQFNKAAIRISFAGYAYPMLVLPTVPKPPSGPTAGAFTGCVEGLAEAFLAEPGDDTLCIILALSKAGLARGLKQ